MEKIKGFKNSFVIYDLFGYLFPGIFFCCLFIIDHDLSKVLNFYLNHKTITGLSRSQGSFLLDYLFKYLTWNNDSTFKFTTLILLLLFCYILGHILAAISSFIFERCFNQACLGFPSDNLLSNAKRNWFQKIFRNYTKSFNSNFIIDFDNIFTERFGPNRINKEKYWLCFSDITKYLPTAYNRIIHFLNLYGFCRNIGASFFVYLIIRFIIMYICFGVKIKVGTWIVLLFFFLSMIICIKNYLKLYYRQSVELYYNFYSLHTDKKYFGQTAHHE